MESILSLISQYGTLVYALLFLYCALKSGWLPLFAAYAAYTGALDVSIVALSTFAGSYFGDELRFIVAKKYGASWITPHSRLGRLFQRAQVLAAKHGKLYLFIYRYPKGLRTIGALPVGLTDMTWPIFTVLNASSAILWTMVLVGGGYFFGATFDAFGLENLTALSLLLLCLFLITLYRVWNSDENQVNKDSASGGIHVKQK